MKKYALAAIVVLLSVMTYYAVTAPSHRDITMATRLYNAKSEGDKETFVRLYANASDKAISLYEDRVNDDIKYQARMAKKRAMAEKAWNK